MGLDNSFFHKNRGFQCIRDILDSLRQGTFKLLDLFFRKWNVLIQFNFVFFFLFLLFFLLLFLLMINFDFLFNFQVCLVTSVWSFDRLQKTSCDLEITRFLQFGTLAIAISQGWQLQSHKVDNLTNLSVRFEIPLFAMEWFLFWGCKYCAYSMVLLLKSKDKTWWLEAFYFFIISNAL